jgi:hypothetical protein
MRRPQRRLHDAVAHRRNPQGPQLLAACLGDVAATNRGGSVGPVPQRLVQRRQVARLVALEGLDRHVVDADAALVGLHSREGRLQAAQRQDLIDHAVPTSSFHPALQGLHHPRRPDGGLYPGVSSRRLSVGISPRGHCRRRPLGGVGHVGCTLLSSGHHVSTFLAPFAPRPLRRFDALYGASDFRAGLLPGHGSPSFTHAASAPILSPTTPNSPRPQPLLTSRSPVFTRPGHGFASGRQARRR